MKKTAREIYLPRLILPEYSNDNIIFSTHKGLPLATNYTRIVIGDRGPYIEFSDEQIKIDNIHIPDDARWRLLPKYAYCYYVEYRSNDEANVKLYLQKTRVDYADYQVGMWYVSPFELTSNKYPILVGEKRK